MARYRLQEAEFVIPDNWTDQTLNIFKLPAVGEAKEASFVISRDPGQGDQPFSEYIAAQLKGAEQQLPGFKLIKQWDFVLHEHTSVLLDYLWEREGRELMLRQVFIECKPAVLIATLTTTFNDHLHHEPAWMSVMRTLEPRTDFA